MEGRRSLAQQPNRLCIGFRRTPDARSAIMRQQRSRRFAGVVVVVDYQYSNGFADLVTTPIALCAVAVCAYVRVRRGRAISCRSERFQEEPTPRRPPSRPPASAFTRSLYRLPRRIRVAFPEHGGQS